MRLPSLYSIIGGLLFLAAGVALLIWGRGPLLWPGVAVAMVGFTMCIFEKNTLAVACGTITAAISLFTQAIYGICMSCIYIAALFGLAGLISSMTIIKTRPLGALLLNVPLLCGALYLGIHIATPGLLAPEQPLTTQHIAQEHTASIPEASVNTTVPVLYFSPWCSHCDDAIRLFIEKDPEGETWQPVAVPHYAIEEGTNYMRELSYTGKITSASRSPGQGLPCMVVEDKTFVGTKQISAWLNN